MEFVFRLLSAIVLVPATHDSRRLHAGRLRQPAEARARARHDRFVQRVGRASEEDEADPDELEQPDRLLEEDDLQHEDERDLAAHARGTPRRRSQSRRLAAAGRQPRACLGAAAAAPGLPRPRTRHARGVGPW
eukprot:3237383-Prymnesium_polylepis.1